MERVPAMTSSASTALQSSSDREPTEPRYRVCFVTARTFVEVEQRLNESCGTAWTLEVSDIDTDEAGLAWKRLVASFVSTDDRDRFLATANAGEIPSRGEPITLNP